MLIIGGGINGAGLARDAAGRGLKVVLVEQGDLGSATSSASSKLVHGGLRYLEHCEFRLVAEALAEREVLLRTAPHLVQPLRFVMPHAPELRPAWLIRLGLLLYDGLARRQTLGRSEHVDLTIPPYRPSLKSRYVHGYSYWDCRVDDARLVIANAIAARDLGAAIRPRTACIGLQREGRSWRVRMRDASGTAELCARIVVNAAGPWAGEIVARAGSATRASLRLVQGSHIVVPRLYEGDHAYIMQNDDRRVVFVCPYEHFYTLIGTTEVALEDGIECCRPREDEIDYLCRAANRYFTRELRPADVVWSYCGVRALVDDGAVESRRLTREYLLQVDGDHERAPLLSVLGGKITTYRRLAERALDKLAPWLPAIGKPWTAEAPLPGGDIPNGWRAYRNELADRYPGLPPALIDALAWRHGSRVPVVLGDARSTADLGTYFGGDLYEREVEYLVRHEWASDAEDVLWRRTKTGLHLSRDQQAKVRERLR